MAKRRFRRTVQALVAGCLLLGTAGTVVADTAKVRARGNDTWKKVHTYIEKGDRVKWTNPDSEQHDVTFYRGSTFSTQLPPGDTARKKFRKKGTALYRCTIHSGIVDGSCQGMCAFVHVL
jgi:plastocyanin